MKNKTAKNPVTGDLIKSKIPNQKYLDNYDKIFNKETKQNSKNTTNQSAN